MTVKLDTGAEINVLPARFIGNNCNIKNTNVKLRTYGDHIIKPIGTISLKVISMNNKACDLNFVIIKENLEPLLSGESCLKLGFIKRICNIESVNFNNKDEFVKSYKDRFTGLGCIPGDYKITLKENYIEEVQYNRRVPFSLHNKLKITLNNLEERKIISKVDYPTEFVNSMIIVEKSDCSLRTCIDPKCLNKQIMREHYKIPTTDDISFRLSQKKIFSVIDLREGFWQIKLSNDSSDLCCFNTPFGRYKFNRMPFGLSVAPEVFQKTMVKIFGDIDGVELYFDDLIISGSTEIEHDTAMGEVMKRARMYNIIFNSKKIQYKQKSITFMGQLITEEGVKPDPKHIRTIQELKSPSTKQELMSIMELFKFLGKFIEIMSKITCNMRELT